MVYFHPNHVRNCTLPRNGPSSSTETEKSLYETVLFKCPRPHRGHQPTKVHFTLILNSGCFCKVLSRWGTVFTTRLGRGSRPDLLRGSLGRQVSGGRAGRREEPPLPAAPWKSRCPCTLRVFFAQFLPPVRRAPQGDRLQLRGGGGGREVWLEITKPAPPGCGRPPCPQGRERDHSMGRRDTPKGPAGEPHSPPRGGGGRVGAALRRRGRLRTPFPGMPSGAGGARMPAPPPRPALTPPPPRPQPGCARRSSGNTMEAAPQPRPRPGGAAAAASASPFPLPPPPPPPPEQERKLEQEKLSGVVKSVHRRLRKKYREGNRGGGGCPPAIRAAQAGPPRSPHRGSRAGGLGAVGNGGAVRRGAAVPRREEGRRPRGGNSARIGVFPRGRSGAGGGGAARSPPKPLPERCGPAGPPTAAEGGVSVEGGGRVVGSSSGLASCSSPQPRRGAPVGSAEALPLSWGGWQRRPLRGRGGLRAHL